MLRTVSAILFVVLSAFVLSACGSAGASKDELFKLLSSCEQYVALDYTIESYDVFAKYREDAIVVFSDKNASQSQVEYVKARLESAISLLTRSYVLAFDVGGGEYIAPIHARESIVVDLPTPVKTNSTFVGWYTDSTFFEECDTVNLSTSMTVYARWLDGSVRIVAEGESISDAITEAPDNSVIFVRPGIFEERLEILKPITLLGNNFDIEANAKRRPETILTTESSQDVEVFFGKTIIEVASSNVVIKGIHIEGDNPNLENIWTSERQSRLYQNTATYLVEGSTAHLSYNYLESLIGDDVGIDSSVAIYIVDAGLTDAVQNVVVENNLVTNFWQVGIYVYGSASSANVTSAFIKSNLFSGVVGLPAYYGSTFYGHYGRAIFLDGNTLSIIDGNQFMNSLQGVHAQTSMNKSISATINNNEFLNVNSGIWLNHTRELFISVTNNRFSFGEDFARYKESPMQTSENNCAVVVTSVLGASIITLNNNQIGGYRYGVAVTCVPNSAVVKISGTKFFDIEWYCIYVPETIMGYQFVKVTYMEIGEGNIYNDNEKFYFSEVNPAKAAYVVENGVVTEYPYDSDE